MVVKNEWSDEKKYFEFMKFSKSLSEKGEIKILEELYLEHQSTLENEDIMNIIFSLASNMLIENKYPKKKDQLNLILLNANCLTELKRYDEALNFINKYLHIEERLNVVKGDIYIKLREYDKSKQVFEELTLKYPDFELYKNKLEEVEYLILQKKNRLNTKYEKFEEVKTKQLSL